MIVTGRISLRTKGNGEVVDITSEVERRVRESGISHGSVTVFVTGSTAGITTIECEPGLLADFQGMWERLAPRTIPYRHDAAWGEGNGYSHVRASLLGPSLVAPLVDGKLVLGTWQQVVLVDFDVRPRAREVVVQTAGE